VSRSLEVRGATGLIANVRAFDRDCGMEIREAVARGGRETKELTQQFCPVDTGFMRDHVRDDYSPDGLTFTVGWKAEEFAAAGLPFYPPYVELGTSLMDAQPSLNPAFETMMPHIQTDVGKALRASIVRASA
jgi:HK97 gp10 family phage protein